MKLFEPRNDRPVEQSPLHAGGGGSPDGEEEAMRAQRLLDTGDRILDQSVSQDPAEYVKRARARGGQ